MGTRNRSEKGRIAGPAAGVSRARGTMLAAACVAALAVAGGLALDAAFPPDLGRAAARSRLVLDADGEVLRAFATPGGAWRITADPGAIDPLYVRMLTAYEDKRFFTHPGVDPLAVARAAFQWVVAGHPVSGASTLTMQTVRLLEPRPRTLVSKAIEAARAIQLERHLGKNDILALYLTIAPYGGNLEGVEAASRFYFGKSARHLTAGQAALLVALPQSPEKVRPDLHPRAARAARNHVLARAQEAGVLDAEQAAAAMREPIPDGRLAAPFRAPHLARRMIAGGPDGGAVHTFLDGTLQDGLQGLAARAVRRLEPGANIAIIVAETKSRKVLAYVGSADFFDDSRAGQVDMVRAVRSPGSTLKPFIYAAAFERFGLHPETLITDEPMRFGDYAPVNFDHRYRGDITMREALQLSLNVPAVAILDRLGPARLAARLEAAGVRPRLDPRVRAPALPMALGGVGLTLEDLVTLYAGLADGGRFAPLRFTPDDPAPEPVRAFDAAAAWYVGAILRDAPGPNGRLASPEAAHVRPIALKTGTSYGFRDAWALGFDSRYTVGVWVGRPDGGFGTGRTGHLQAAPLVYDVFDRLPVHRGVPAVPPDGVVAARTTADLPPPLRRFRPRAEARLALAPDESGFAIAFPPDGATVELQGNPGRPLALSLRAAGGRKPVRWLIDGRPIAAPAFKRTAIWSAAHQGSVRITALDARGRAATADVWIARAP